MKRSGVVKTFSSRKGYGFVCDLAKDVDFFFHYTDIVSDQEFKKFFGGEHVVFEIIEGEKGLRACNVTRYVRKKDRDRQTSQ